jgi:hypothetical protein
VPERRGGSFPYPCISQQASGVAFEGCDSFGGLYAEFIAAFLLKKSNKENNHTTFCPSVRTFHIHNLKPRKIPLE